MKITDVTVTLFAWEGLPTISYHIVQKAGQKHDLGLLTITTDEGIEGHAFLGKVIEPGSSDAAAGGTRSAVAGTGAVEVGFTAAGFDWTSSAALVTSLPVRASPSSIARSFEPVSS